MTTAATPAYGLGFKVTAGTAIAEITNLDGPNVERDSLEVTNMQSASSSKEFIAGLIDSGEVTLAINYLPQNATHKLILTDLQAASSAATKGYTLTLPDSGTSVCTCSMFVKSFKITGAVAGVLTASVTFKATGPVTWPT